MEKKNKVSLWLGYFEKEDEFRRYMEIGFNEDGDFIPSMFQKQFGILSYDLDSSEIDWITNRCDSIKNLLAGFSYDLEIIPQFEKMLKNKDVKKYNCIVLLYNYEHKINFVSSELEYIGCAEITI